MLNPWTLSYFSAFVVGTAAWLLLGDKVDQSFFNTAAEVSAALAIALVFQERVVLTWDERFGLVVTLSLVTVLGIGGGLVGGTLEDDASVKGALAFTTIGVAAGILGLLVLIRGFARWGQSEEE